MTEITSYVPVAEDAPFVISKPKRAAKPKMDVDRRTGEARCPHHNLHGNVCDSCFAVTPFLSRSYGRTYRMTGSEWAMDADLIAEGSLVVSPATPVVQVVPSHDLRIGDKIYGYSAVTRPMVVSEVLAPGVFMDDRNRRVRLTETTVSVQR